MRRVTELEIVGRTSVPTDAGHGPAIRGGATHRAPVRGILEIFEFDGRGCIGRCVRGCIRCGASRGCGGRNGSRRRWRTGRCVRRGVSWGCSGRDRRCRRYRVCVRGSPISQKAGGRGWIRRTSRNESYHSYNSQSKKSEQSKFHHGLLQEKFQKLWQTAFIQFVFSRGCHLTGFIPMPMTLKK